MTNDIPVPSISSHQHHCYVVRFCTRVHEITPKRNIKDSMTLNGKFRLRLKKFKQGILWGRGEVNFTP